VAWGHDNRTCALRVVGHGAGLRFENRVPGGDVNPYLAVAAMIAAGLYGIEHGLELPEAFVGNAYDSDAERVPQTLREAADLLTASTIARESLGDAVVDHYANAARVELAAFDAAVTDWELIRSFERM
jgi:glutamine synthetase